MHMCMHVCVWNCKRASGCVCMFVFSQARREQLVKEMRMWEGVWECVVVAPRRISVFILNMA